MDLVLWEFKKFEACRKKGFIHLEWDEGTSEIDGWHGHEAWVVGRKIVVHALIDHIVINPQVSMRKKYIVGISFTHKSDLANVFCRCEPHMELEIDSAVAYAEWQVTSIFRLIEGEDAEPVNKNESR